MSGLSNPMVSPADLYVNTLVTLGAALTLATVIVLSARMILKNLNSKPKTKNDEKVN